MWTLKAEGLWTDAVAEMHQQANLQRPDITGEEATQMDLIQGIIERNILGFFRHADALRKAGQGTRHGVLLHGPPGTGKTLVTRYLATNVGATVLLVTGRQYSLLRPTCQLARLLAPSLLFVLLLTPPIEYVDPDAAGWTGGYWAFVPHVWSMWPPAPGPTVAIQTLRMNIDNQITPADPFRRFWPPAESGQPYGADNRARTLR